MEHFLHIGSSATPSGLQEPQQLLTNISLLLYVIQLHVGIVDALIDRLCKSAFGRMLQQLCCLSRRDSVECLVLFTTCFSNGAFERYILLNIVTNRIRVLCVNFTCSPTRTDHAALLARRRACTRSSSLSSEAYHIKQLAQGARFRQSQNAPCRQHLTRHCLQWSRWNPLFAFCSARETQVRPVTLALHSGLISPSFVAERKT